MPIETYNYALLKEATSKDPDEADFREISEKARAYFHRFESDRLKISEQGLGEAAVAWQDQIAGIIQEIRRVGVEQQTFILEQLGVHPIWYKDHSEIPQILNSIAS